MNGPDPKQTWSKSAGLLAVSIGLNLALAVGALVLLARPATPPAAPAGLPVATVRIAEVVVTNEPGAILFVTNRFHWRQIESTNYDEYVAKLRAIGCPEKTVRDIIVADVGKYYESRRRALNRNQPFWRAGRQRQLADREQAKQFDALQEEQRALIRRLLGIEILEQGSSEGFAEQALSRFLLGPMPADTFQRFLVLADKCERINSEVRRRAQGIFTEADEAELRTQAARWRQELGALLTPSQIDELKARTTALEFFMDHGDWTEAVELTPAEARQIALARAGEEGALSELFNGHAQETDEESAAHEAQFTNAVSALLGEKRFADFVRAQDRNFLDLFTLTRDHNLPRDSAVKVYDLRQFAAEETRRIRGDSGLDEAARRQQIEEMQSALQQSVSGVLGAKAYQEYLNHDGAWITNVTKL